MTGRGSTRLGRVMLTSTIFFLCPLMLHAQEIALSGTVTDATDAVMPGVTVTAVHTDTGNTFVGVTDATGSYLISGLRAGTYTLKLDASWKWKIGGECLNLL